MEVLPSCGAPLVARRFPPRGSPGAAARCRPPRWDAAVPEGRRVPGVKSRCFASSARPALCGLCIYRCLRDLGVSFFGIWVL